MEELNSQVEKLVKCTEELSNRIAIQNVKYISALNRIEKLEAKYNEDMNCIEKIIENVLFELEFEKDVENFLNKFMEGPIADIKEKKIIPDKMVLNIHKRKLCKDCETNDLKNIKKSKKEVSVKEAIKKFEDFIKETEEPIEVTPDNDENII